MPRKPKTEYPSDHLKQLEFMVKEEEERARKKVFLGSGKALTEAWADYQKEVTSSKLRRVPGGRASMMLSISTLTVQRIVEGSSLMGIPRGQYIDHVIDMLEQGKLREKLAGASTDDADDTDDEDED